MPVTDRKTFGKRDAPREIVRLLRQRAVKPRDPSFRCLFGREYIDIRVEATKSKRRIVGCLVDAHLRNRDLDLLTGLKDLKSLRLFMLGIPADAQITDEGLSQLHRLRRLQDLSFEGCRHVTDEGIAYLALLRGLRALAFDSMEQITDGALIHLQGLHDLRSLTLSRTAVIGAELSRLARMTRLCQLSLSGSPIGKGSLNHLGHLCNLRVLDLGGSNTSITDAGLASLEHCKRLESLCLWDNRHIRGAFLKTLARLPGLKELWLRWTPIEEKHLVHLAAFSRLEVLDLSHTGLSNAAVVHLVGLTNLRILHLNETNVSGKALRLLVGLTKLEYLGIGDRVSTEDIRVLRGALPNLKCG